MLPSVPRGCSRRPPVAVYMKDTQVLNNARNRDASRGRKLYYATALNRPCKTFARRRAAVLPVPSMRWLTAVPPTLII